MLPRKSLILFVFFMLKISSICRSAQLARAGGGWREASQQSYPQLLWASSYTTGVFSYTQRRT
jgi:hypothetical protein